MNLPTISCKKIHHPIALSGKIDDPSWPQAQVVPLQDAITGGPGRFTTTVRTLYNEHYFYVAFDCQDDYIWGTVSQRDGAIFDEECVEVFLCPANALHQYYEIDLSPKNVLFDACIINNRVLDHPQEPFLGFAEWNLKGFYSRVHVDGTLDQEGQARRWCCELAIPLAELFGAKYRPPQPGDVWRANFYRIDSPRKSHLELYAWSKTGAADFHRPWRFGRLKFID